MKKKIIKKSWLKPELKSLDFKQTLGGTLRSYPENEGGTVS